MLSFSSFYVARWDIPVKKKKSLIFIKRMPPLAEIINSKYVSSPNILFLLLFQSKLACYPGFKETKPQARAYSTSLICFNNLARLLYDIFI
jgi:hypothetical protein